MTYEIWIGYNRVCSMTGDEAVYEAWAGFKAGATAACVRATLMDASTGEIIADNEDDLM